MMGEFLLTDADEAFRSGLWRLDADSACSERLPKTTVGTTISKRRPCDDELAEASSP
jgi:hypothetical protein